MLFNSVQCYLVHEIRGGSRTAATSRMMRFVIIVNGFQPLNIITKHSILDVAAVPNPLLEMKREQTTSWLYFSMLHYTSA